MGNSRHRWTLDEENALRAGVGKYGTGKWRKILTDEEFAPRLIARNNVDLKDKWRNLCGNASRTTVPLKCTTNMETDIRNLKALPSTSNSDGLDVVAIHSYPEDRIQEEYRKVTMESGESSIDEVEVEVECVKRVVKQRRGPSLHAQTQATTIGIFIALAQQLSEQFEQMQQHFDKALLSEYPNYKPTPPDDEQDLREDDY